MLSAFVVDITEDIARLIRDRAVIIYDNTLRRTKIACSFEFVNRIAELLSSDDIAGRVIIARGFNPGDAILRAAIHKQVESTVKWLHREGAVENVGRDARANGSCPGV